MSEEVESAPESLHRLFAPRSIALVGATDRSVWSVSAYDNLVRFGFSGKVHLINPKGGVIHGIAAATSCAAVGEPIDAALLMVPESKLFETFDDLAHADVRGAVVLASGFAETGAAGVRRQAELAEHARSRNIRLIGPNCLGFANFLASTAIWTTPLRRPMPNPSLALVSQSGALAAQLEQFAYQQRIALTHMVSTGNEADVTVADAIAYIAAQPEPRAIALFLETVRDPRRFIAAIEAARAANKTVVVLKVGSSETTARAAQAHTGSLVGNDRVFTALCRKLGMLRVKSLEELIVTADLAGQVRPHRRSRGLALLAMSGGLCEIATDRAEELSLNIPVLAQSTMTALRAVLPPMATPGNPTDLTGAAMLEPELITKTIQTVAQDDSVDMLAFVFDVPPKEDKRGVARNFIKHVSDGFAAIDKPGVLLSHTLTAVTEEGRALTDGFNLTYSGSGITLGLTALANILSQMDSPARLPDSRHTTEPTAGRPKSERAVLEYLATYGVPVVAGPVAKTVDEAIAAARSFDGPVVLKVASADIQHKTEVGGVALNVSGDAQVADRYRLIRERVTAAKPEATIDGVIVSPMRQGNIELFVGTMRDPQWGPCIAVGLGGVWIEALKDSALRLLPVTHDDARAMLDELRGGTLLDGFRGGPIVNRSQVAEAIVAIGNAALALGPELVALEVNPLLANADCVEAVDGLAAWSDHA